MKKLICILILLGILGAFALAEGFDFSSYSYDELISMRNVLTAEIMSRPEWKEVQVPSGIRFVGVDIPAGFYAIKCGESYSLVDIADKDGEQILYSIFDPGYVYGEIELKDGYKIRLSDTVTFMPPLDLEF